MERVGAFEAYFAYGFPLAEDDYFEVMDLGQDGNIIVLSSGYEEFDVRDNGFVAHKDLIIKAGNVGEFVSVDLSQLNKDMSDVDCDIMQFCVDHNIKYEKPGWHLFSNGE